MAHRFKFGIEEEYFLANTQTAHSPSKDAAIAFHEEAARRVDAAEHELLVGQIEVSTKPGDSLEDSLATLRGFRQQLSEIASNHGLLLFAAGSHPLALPAEQHVSSTSRYQRLGDELKLIAPKAAVSAMHVHVEVPDVEARFNLINRLTPFLPLLHALSVSSPFWEGHESGLQGYRLTAFSQWPRSGLPGWFGDQAQYERYIERLTAAGFIEDASVVWSHIRPSVHYPTIEMRICDSCTRVSDAIAIASLYRAVVSLVVRRPEINARFGPVEHAICRTNLWRAQQAGIAATFADVATDRAISVEDMLNHTLELTAEDFDNLGMRAWPTSLRSIVQNGTSADRQLASYASCPDNAAGLRSVVGKLADETRGE